MSGVVRVGRDVCDALVARVIDLCAENRGWTESSGSHFSGAGAQREGSSELMQGGRTEAADVSSGDNGNGSSKSGSNDVAVHVVQAVNIGEEVPSRMRANAANLGMDIRNSLTVKATVQVPVSANQAVALWRSSSMATWCTLVARFQVLESLDDETFVAVSEFRFPPSPPRTVCELYHFRTIADGWEVAAAMPVRHSKFERSEHTEELAARCSGWLFRDIEGHPGHSTVTFMAESVGVLSDNSQPETFQLSSLLGIVARDFAVYVGGLLSGSANEVFRRQGHLMLKELYQAMTNPRGPGTLWRQIFNEADLPPGMLLPHQTARAYEYAFEDKLEGQHTGKLIDVCIRSLVDGSLDAVRQVQRSPRFLLSHEEIPISSSPDEEIAIYHITRYSPQSLGGLADICSLRVRKDIGGISTATASRSVEHNAFPPVPGSLRINFNIAGHVSYYQGQNGKLELLGILRFSSADLAKNKGPDADIRALELGTFEGLVRNEVDFVRSIEEEAARSSNSADSPSTNRQNVELQPPLKRQATESVAVERALSDITGAPLMRLDTQIDWHKSFPEILNGSNSRWRAFFLFGDAEDEPNQICSSMFECLPEPIVLRIFEYLPSSSLHTLDQVCRRTRRIARTDGLWKKFYMERRTFGMENGKPARQRWRDAVCEDIRLRNSLAELTVTADHQNVIHNAGSNAIEDIVTVPGAAVGSVLIAIVTCKFVRILLSHKRSVGRFSGGLELLRTFELPGHTPSSVWIANDGDVWLAYTSGVIACFDASSSTIKYLSRLDTVGSFKALKLDSELRVVRWDERSVEVWQCPKSPQGSSSATLLAACSELRDITVAMVRTSTESVEVITASHNENGTLSRFKVHPVPAENLPVTPGSTARSVNCVWQHGSAVRALALCHNSNSVASGADDGSVSIWDLRIPVPELIQRVNAHLEPLSALRLHTKFIITGSSDNTVRVWKRRSIADPPSFSSPIHTVIRVGSRVGAVSLEHSRLVAGLMTGEVIIWEV